jgi:hypothetical protein
MTRFYVTSFICSSVHATLTSFSVTSALVIEKIIKIVKVQILFVCMGQQRKLVKVIRVFDVIGQLATNKLSE